MDAVVAVALVVVVLVLATWALVREVRADGSGRRPLQGPRDWGDRRTPSCPYSQARW